MLTVSARITSKPSAANPIGANSAIATRAHRAKAAAPQVSPRPEREIVRWAPTRSVHCNNLPLCSTAVAASRSGSRLRRCGASGRPVEIRTWEAVRDPRPRALAPPRARSPLTADPTPAPRPRRRPDPRRSRSRVATTVPAGAPTAHQSGDLESESEDGDAQQRLNEDARGSPIGGSPVARLNPNQQCEDLDHLREYRGHEQCAPSTCPALCLRQNPTRGCQRCKDEQHVDQPPNASTAAQLAAGP